MAIQGEPVLPLSGRPSGTITFCFSDIEGSTARWERGSEPMSAALARHDAHMRAAIEAHRGYVFKTIGDAFCAAFGTAPDALLAALDAQRSLAREDFSIVGGLRVRMALHSGTAEQRDGDYFGTTVNRVARLLPTAHGGQIVASAACAELLHGELPADCTLRDLGKHRLKDLAHPEHIYQVTAEGLPESFPPLRSLDNLSNNLPAQLTSFVGRENVVAEIEALLEVHRLVTLVGTGGAGKTRCAIQVAAELLDGSGDGVWLVELARISDPSLVASTLARVLGIPDVPDRPVLDSLLAYLKRKHLLLVIDNCEHVIDEARRVVSAILRSCPEVVVLATSREALNIEGEHRFRMPSLSLPSVQSDFSCKSLLDFAAPLLFVHRARAADHGFSVTNENAQSIGEICRRLDGIPLAIELAAARTKVLAPAQLAQKLNERFRVLTGGDRAGLPRHQTMRALIDWSYDLLSAQEQAVFRKLSVFAGTFSLESAAAVCATQALDELGVLDILASLVDKSLLQSEASGEDARYRMLESTRQYARERLIELNEHESTARGHAYAFLRKAEALERSYESTPDRVWGPQVELELENWRAALEWSLIGRGDVHLGQRLAGATRWIWLFFSPSEGLRWVQLASATVDENTNEDVHAKLDLAEAISNLPLIRYETGYDVAKRAFARLQPLGDERAMAEVGWALGRSAVFTRRFDEGKAALEAALSIAEPLGLLKLTCWILAALVQHALDNGDLVTPAALYEKALRIAKSNRFDRMVAVLEGMIAEYRFELGDPESAVQHARESLDASRALNDRRTLMNTLGNMSAYLTALKQYDAAAKHALEALNIGRENQTRVHIVIDLQHLAAIVALRPNADPALAAQLLGFVDKALRELQVQREYTERHEYGVTLFALRELLGDEELATLMSAGSAWSEDEALASVKYVRCT